MPQPVYLRRIGFWLAVFIVGLVLSGITAFPLQSELGWFVSFLHKSRVQPAAESTHLLPWIERVDQGLRATNARYPLSCLRHGLARLCPFGYRCGISWTLPRSSAKQMGHHFRPDRLRWRHSSGSYCRADPGHSTRLATHRLQLWSSWQHPSPDMQKAHH
jgi:hypothetical protein